MIEFKEYIVLGDYDPIYDKWDDYLYQDCVIHRLVDKNTNQIIMEGDNFNNWIDDKIDNLLSGVAYVEDIVNIDRYIIMPDGTEKYCYTKRF